MLTTTFGFIGLGLIGGSIAKAIRRVYQENAVIMAYDTNADTLSSAVEEGILTMSLSGINEHFHACDYIFLCAPVSLNCQNLTALKPFLSEGCILTDVGSVKTPIHQTVEDLDLSHCFIGGHPMAGSEKTGYAYATDRLIENAYYILTPTPTVPACRVKSYGELATSLGSIPMILEFTEHDYVTAAVSHLPHIIASSLVNLVRDSDTGTGIMKLIAAGGFKDITRIASSSASMWQQISLINSGNIHKLLSDYIFSLQKIEQELSTQDEASLYRLFDSAREYRSSFPDAARGPLKKIHVIHIDIPDETGVIATIATLLAAHQINLRNIGIVHNREFEEGALRIEFYEEAAMNQACLILQKHNYTIYKR